MEVLADHCGRSTFGGLDSAIDWRGRSALRLVLKKLRDAMAVANVAHFAKVSTLFHALYMGFEGAE